MPSGLGKSVGPDVGSAARALRKVNAGITDGYVAAAWLSVTLLRTSRAGAASGFAAGRSPTVIPARKNTSELSIGV